MAVNLTQIELLRKLLRHGATDRVVRITEKLRPTEIAEVFGYLSPAEQRQFVDILFKHGDAASTLLEIPDGILTQMLPSFRDERVGALLADMAPDDAYYIIGLLDEDRVDPILARLPKAQRERVEHMRNYPELFRRISNWLRPEGRFFMHIFCHRSTPYEFVDRGPNDWMSRHFFSGGIMPSADLPMRIGGDLAVERHWQWHGDHYARTLRAWLDKMDARKGVVMPILEDTYGKDQADRWRMRWRIFFMACEELFAYNGGNEWYVSHYLLKRVGD